MHACMHALQLDWVHLCTSRNTNTFNARALQCTHVRAFPPHAYLHKRHTRVHRGN